MNRDLLEGFVTSMIPQMLKAGTLAVEFQGKVSNLKKVADVDENAPQRIKDRSQAKTEIDERVQEILLTCVYENFGVKGVKIDAEEDTPSRNLFIDVNTSFTVVIDPIDGTLEYLNGKKMTI